MSEPFESRQMSKFDRADPKVLFMSQVTRCLQTTGTPYFDANVEALLRLLPTASYLALMAQSDSWEDERIIFSYVSNCGIRVGSVEDPILLPKDKNKSFTYLSEIENPPRLPGPVVWADENIAGSINTSEDPDYVIETPILFDESIPVKTLPGEIDWEDSRIYSPKRRIESYTDYDQMFRMILSESQTAGIWWSEMGGGVVNLPEGIAEALKATKSMPRTPQ